jgi:hypothetical protein
MARRFGTGKALAKKKVLKKALDYIGEKKTGQSGICFERECRWINRCQTEIKYQKKSIELGSQR